MMVDILFWGLLSLAIIIFGLYTFTLFRDEKRRHAELLKQLEELTGMKAPPTDQSEELSPKKSDPLPVFGVICQELAKLPKPLKANNVEALRQVSQILNVLSKELRMRAEPFRSWAEKLGDTVNGVNTLVSSWGFQKLLGNPTQRVGDYLNRYLADQVAGLYGYCQEADFEPCEAAISNIYDSTDRIVKLTKNWQELAGRASQGIGKPRLEKYVELRHCETNIFRDPKDKAEWNWTPFALREARILQGLSQWIVQIIRDYLGWEFNVVCSISASALPVATLISVETESELLVRDNETFEFAFREPRSTDRIVVVDSMVQTGAHLLNAKTTIESSGATFVGAICVVENDMMPEGKNPIDLIKDLKEQGKMIYVYKMSELYEEWVKATRR